MIIVYRKKNFVIYSGNKSHIVHNTNKDFENGHSHIRNFKTAKYIIDLSIHKSIPNHINIYLLKSLIRLSEDDNYNSKLESLINNKIKKLNKCKYINRR